MQYVSQTWDLVDTLPGRGASKNHKFSKPTHRRWIDKLVQAKYHDEYSKG